MIRFAAARMAQGIAALWIVVTIVFALARFNSDPAVLLAAPDATPADIEQLRQSLGLDRPVLEQYGTYLLDVARGDFGQSLSFGGPVRDLVATALGNTAQLAVVAFVLAVVLGVTFGLISGMRPGGTADRAIRLTSLIGQSVPPFWLGILLILLFAVHLNVLPAVGNATPSSVVLPAIALGAFPLAAFARLTRSSVIEIMNRDQTLFQRTKGLHPAVLVRHVLRNSSLPVVTLAGIQFGNLISGTIVIEVLFGWPGVGQLAIQAISSSDYALIQGVVIANTAVFIVMLFLVDVSYGLLDPRTRRADVKSTR